MLSGYRKILFFIVLPIFFLSCEKESVSYQEIPVNKLENISVPDGFLFNASKKVTVKFSSTYNEQYAVVEIYRGDPNLESSVVFSGKLIDNRFEHEVIVPSYSKDLYIRLKLNNGISKFFKVPIVNNIANYIYNPSIQSKSINANNVYDCDANCTQTLPTSGTYENIIINDGETLCIPEGVIVDGSININGGTLSVCGTVNSTLSFGSVSSTIIIGELAEVSISSINSNIRIINYNNNFILPSVINGYVENYANINLDGNLILSSGSEFVNFGEVNISGNIDNNGSIINNSSISMNQFTQKTSGSCVNNCHFFVTTNLTQMSPYFTNNSYIYIGGLLQITEGAIINLTEQSLIECDNLLSYGTLVNNSSDYARIEININSYLYQSSNLAGLIDFCDNDGIELLEGSIDHEVQYCKTAIQATECNPGIGSVNIVDTDNDGVNDDLDNFPTDPDRAFVSYFPEKNFGTFAFEDLWPYKGDYDFNDLVINYQYQLILNSVGWVKEIQYTYKLVAVGGSFKNGFGVQFPVDASQVESNTYPINLSEGIINLSSKYIESNQSKAVVICFDNASRTLGYPGGNVTGINTTNGAPYSNPAIVIGTIIFISPQDIMEKLPFNPFMFINLDRGKEVHLIGEQPTDLVNIAYFNTGNDASANGIYYKTEQNLPWALNFLNEFDYPMEKSEITTAYLKFYEWASSGGINYSDWYLNHSGYRNSNNIYSNN